MLTNFPNAFPDSKEVPSEGQARLIVELDSSYNQPGSETPKVKICFQKWATGIGWFNQKSLYLTLEQAGFLQKEIERTAVNHKMVSTQSRPANLAAQPTPATAESGQRVIQFPAGKSKKSATGRSSRSHSEETSSTTAKILPFRSS